MTFKMTFWFEHSISKATFSHKSISFSSLQIREFSMALSDSYLQTMESTLEQMLCNQKAM